MKTLLLMRHAKSSWKDATLADYDRPLNKRGHRDALTMGEILKEKELLPQQVLASTARRVRETVEELAKGGALPGKLEYVEDFYLAEPEVYRTRLSALPEDVERVMVIGHNPGLEGLLQQLTGRIESLSTGSIAYISLPVQTWAGLTGEVEGELVELMRPAEPEEEKEKKGKKDKKVEKDEKKEEKKDEKKEDKKEEKKEEKKDEKKEKEKKVDEKKKKEEEKKHKDEKKHKK